MRVNGGERRSALRFRFRRPFMELSVLSAHLPQVCSLADIALKGASNEYLAGEKESSPTPRVSPLHARVTGVTVAWGLTKGRSFHGPRETTNEVVFVFFLIPSCCLGSACATGKDYAINWWRNRMTEEMSVLENVRNIIWLKFALIFICIIFHLPESKQIFLIHRCIE